MHRPLPLKSMENTCKYSNGEPARIEGWLCPFGICSSNQQLPTVARARPALNLTSFISSNWICSQAAALPAQRSKNNCSRYGNQSQLFSRVFRPKALDIHRHLHDRADTYCRLEVPCSLRHQWTMGAGRYSRLCLPNSSNLHGRDKHPYDKPEMRCPL